MITWKPISICVPEQTTYEELEKSVQTAVKIVPKDIRIKYLKFHPTKVEYFMEYYE